MTKQPNTTLWKISTSTKGIMHLFCKGLNEICMCSRDGWLTQFDSESCQRYLLHHRGGWKQLMLGCSHLEDCSWGTCESSKPSPKGWRPSQAVHAEAAEKQEDLVSRAHHSPAGNLCFLSCFCWMSCNALRPCAVSEICHVESGL